MLVSANGVAVIGGSILFPLTGTWTADLVLDQPSGDGFDAGTSVTIAAENNYSVTGTVTDARTGDFLDAVHVRLIGGAGGLGTIATAQAFAQPGVFARDVVNALMADAGETLSTMSDASFLATSLGGWFITPTPVGQQLQTLVNVINRQQGAAYNWRILADGTIWFGQESWPSGSGTFDLIRQSPSDAMWDLGVESPFVMPGTTLTTVGQVGRVEHYIQAKRIRQRVWQFIANDDRGLPGAIRGIVKQQTAAIDFLGYYEAKVISQSVDGSTVDVSPIDPRFAGTQRLELRHGIPGVTVQIVPGATIMMGFKSGDPSMAYVHSWNPGASLLSITLTDQAGDSIAIANGMVTVKAAGVQVIQASPTALALGLVGTLPLLPLGSTDAIFGAPVLINPAAAATIVRGG